MEGEAGIEITVGSSSVPVKGSSDGSVIGAPPPGGVADTIA